MGIRAVFSSSVFKNNDSVFETISIDMKGGYRESFSAIILVREAEIQCFGYDADDKYILDESEWKYLNSKHFDRISRQRITHECNKATVNLVNKYDVDDVSEKDEMCVTARDELEIVFGNEKSFDNLIDADCLHDFELTLFNSLGASRTSKILNFFREHFKELPHGMSFDLPQAKAQRNLEEKQPQYPTWALFG